MAESVSPALPVSPNIHDLITAYAANQQCKVFPTGLKELDKFLTGGGLTPDTLTIIGGRPSEGKTSFSLFLARRMAEQGARVLYLSIEQTALEMTERLLCQWLDKTPDDLAIYRKDQRLMEVIRPLVAQAFRALKFQIHDETRGTIEDVRVLLDALRQGQDALPEVLVIDHLQQIWMPEGISRNDGIACYLRDLKQLTKEFHLNTILCSQLNRDAMKTRDKQGHFNPQMWNLKDSGAIEESADRIFLCWRKSMDDETFLHTPNLDSEYVVRIAKQRNGPTGEIYLLFRPSRFDFQERIGSWGQQETQAWQQPPAANAPDTLPLSV